MRLIGGLIGWFCLIFTIIFVVVVAFSPDPKPSTSSEDKTVQQEVSQQKETVKNDWKSVFLANGFTEQEVATYEQMLTKVGITDYHHVDIVENGIMHIVRGKIYNDNTLQLNITLENRQIILIELAGLPAKQTEAYINWRGRIKFRTVDTKKSVDLYYDMDGGYKAVLDWENKMLSAIE